MKNHVNASRVRKYAMSAPTINSSVYDAVMWDMVDPIVDDMDKSITCRELIDKMNAGEDFYDIIGVGDSLLRERVFSVLSYITGLDYDVFYDAWLHGTKITASRKLASANHRKCAAGRKTAGFSKTSTTLVDITNYVYRNEGISLNFVAHQLEREFPDVEVVYLDSEKRALLQCDECFVELKWMNRAHTGMIVREADFYDWEDVIASRNARRKTADDGRYDEWGGRDGYLRDLAFEFDVPEDTVFMLADLLGPNEDFDGLINSLEDYEDYGGFYASRRRASRR